MTPRTLPWALRSSWSVASGPGRGRVKQALRDAREAVSLLTPAADVNRTAYGPDLADALVSLSDRESEAGAGEQALGTAQRAVTLCEQLAQTHPWAHAARLAAALLVLGRRHAETHSVTGAVQHTEHAVSRYRKLARASPLRFEPLLAEAETYHALALLAADRSRDAHAAGASAIARLRAGDLDSHRAQLAWSLVQLAKILVSLGSAPNAAGLLAEAHDIYRLLPLKSKRDTDAMSDAEDLLDSSG